MRYINLRCVSTKLYFEHFTYQQVSWETAGELQNNSMSTDASYGRRKERNLSSIPVDMLKAHR